MQNIDALIAVGPSSGAPGWADVIAIHTGDYLDMSAANKPVEFNGLDFWKIENDRCIENWVLLAMVHLFRRLGLICSFSREHQLCKLESD